MRKKLTWLIGAILVIALIVFGCLYFIPQATPDATPETTPTDDPKITPINITLNAAKASKENSTISVLKINLRGKLEEYPNQNLRITLSIDDFDHLYNIRSSLNPDPQGNYPSVPLEQPSENGYYSLTFLASSTITGEDSVALHVSFNKELNKWDLFPEPSIYADEKYSEDPSFRLTYRGTSTDINATKQDTTITINMQTNGIWGYKDGIPKAAKLSIIGTIYDSAKDQDTLDVDIVFPSTFPYLFMTSNTGELSTNQKYSILPHLMICPTYVYDKSTNAHAFCYFALDLENNCCIFLFETSKDYYFVASQDGSMTYEQLLAHFSDFIDVFAPQVWKA